MAGLRAPRAGSARENQIKVENSFDSEEALKCLAWIREVTGEPINLESVLDNKHKVSEFFYRTLKDGILLCKLVNAIVPDDIQINMKSQTFKKSNNDAFESAKERASHGNICQSWEYLPVMGISASHGNICQSWEYLPVMGISASHGNICQSWEYLPVMGISASHGNICQSWEYLPVMGISASHGNICQSWEYLPVMRISASHENICQS
ncbi:myophilin-like isoform X2 [Biomphalaria glabrata]